MQSDNTSSKKKFETLAIRSGKKPSVDLENSVPIFFNSGFKFPDSETSRLLFNEEIPGFVYSRYSNPGMEDLQTKMCQLEGLDKAFATSSGMSAIFLGICGLLSQGDHLLACRSLFGSTHQLITKILPRFGIEYTYVDIDEQNSWEKYVQQNTKMLFLETPSNPGLDLVDLQLAGQLAKNHNLIFFVDNSFASPYLQQPAIFGAHIVAHSTTKVIDGQGRSLGGIIISKNEIFDKIEFLARQTGPVMSPFNAWIISKSLETLAIRLDRHCSNALELASRLENLAQVKTVKYPFLDSHPQFEIAKKQMLKGGPLLTMELRGSFEETIKFVDNLKMISISANLGDSRTIITHPRLTTHSKLTESERVKAKISDNLLRISVGLENIEDIWQDIKQAVSA